jgi:hypothetical protein
LTYANVLATLAVVIAIGGGSAYAVNRVQDTDPAGVGASATTGACEARVVTLTPSDGARVLCAVGSLTLLGNCQAAGITTRGVVFVDTTTDHAFASVLGSRAANIMAADPPRMMFFADETAGDGPTVSEDEAFTVAEAPAAGGRLLEGAAAIRVLHRGNPPTVEKCLFAISAVTD